MDEEQSLFKGSPSLALVFGPLLISLTVVAASIFAGYQYSSWAFLASGVAVIYGLGKIGLVKAIHYELTTERIRVRRGIFTKRTDELELYRVKDATIVEPFFYRLFGVGNIQITTTDASTPTLVLSAVRGAAGLRESLRHSVEACRKKKGVRLTELE
ncbi:MAG: PH domain-containing protein [Pedosphaera sp.]|nr:PH domain-containing protein [Pedosphaera sp.]